MNSITLQKKFRKIEKTENLIIFNYLTDSQFIYDDLVTEGTAHKICRENIEQKFIEDIFAEIDMEGYIMMIDNVYIGFVLFKYYGDGIEIKLLGSRKCYLTSGLPIGQYLIHLVEEDAIKKGLNLLYADSIPGALDFYLNTGWEFCNPEDEEIYLLEYCEEKDDNYCEVENEDKENRDTFEIQKTINLSNHMLPYEPMDIDSDDLIIECDNNIKIDINIDEKSFYNSNNNETLFDKLKNIINIF